MSTPDQDAGFKLPDERTEKVVLWRIRRQSARAQLRQLMNDSRLRTFLVLGLSLFFWFGLYLLFFYAFNFLQNEVVLEPSSLYSSKTIEFVFHLFFASLNVMLIFSSGIILYGSLFDSEEADYLLSLPIRPERIVMYKFQEALLFSSWGFFLLASPLTIAFGVSSGAPWYYYVLIVPLIFSFAYIPSSLGAICCLLLVYRFTRVRLFLLILLAAGSLYAAGNAVWETVQTPTGYAFTSEWLEETLRRFRFTRGEWLPSTWLSHALLDAARNESTPVSFWRTPAVTALMNLLLLIANALLCRLMLTGLGARCFKSAYNRIHGLPQRKRKGGPVLIDRIAWLLLAPFSHKVRLLLIKDWRLLRRDPVQWSQFLIFFGLLGLYFLNMNRFRGSETQMNQVTWINMVSFLNLAVVGLILSTFTTRFIYPMISLEGRRFWVLGLVPVRRDTIVLSKYYFAAFGSWFPCALLVLLSDLMLHVSTKVILAHQFGVILLCSGLSALAVGLGASMPNFHEPSPSKIAAGFGGTLNLVLSAIYIICVVVLTALPMHLYVFLDISAIGGVFSSTDSLDRWVLFGLILASALGIIATIAPLRRGIRAFRNLEFY